jgi:hypothetical protein
LLLSSPANDLGSSVFLMTIAQLISTQISISTLKETPELTELTQMRQSVRSFIDNCNEETPHLFQEGAFKQVLSELLEVCPTPPSLSS